MSTLLLIRHGQARAFDADSDRLSELGEAQARTLGDYLVRTGAEFDEVVAGSLVRQKRTAAIVGDAFAAAKRAFPSITTDADWNEYDAGGVLGTLLPLLAERDAAFARLVSEFHDRAAHSDRNRFFQRMFEALMDAWERGSVQADGVESFAAFHSRTSEAFLRLTSAGGRRRVAVFTSGGPIGVCTQTVLDAPTKTSLKLNWRVQNASLTEFIFSEGRASLESFNGVGHLPPAERTFR